MQAIATKRLSCGIVVLSGERDVLLCHVTGREQWDLPKGGSSTGESPVEAALRETREETGLLFETSDLFDIGRHAFSERKDLHLYAVRTERFDVNKLWCESQFSHAWSGNRLPEMDGYGWFDIEHAPALCSSKMARLLGEKIDLAALAARLVRVVEPVFALRSNVTPAAPVAPSAAHPTTLPNSIASAFASAAAYAA